MSTLLKPGTLVEITSVEPRETFLVGPWPVGTQFITGEYVSEKESGLNATAFYWGDMNGGTNNIWAPADSVKVIKTVTEMESRTVPTREQVMQELGSALLVIGDGFRITEATMDRSIGTIKCAGTTDDGLHFAFTVALTPPRETDF